MDRENFQAIDFDQADQPKLDQIKSLFEDIYPKKTYGDLAEKITLYWRDKLKHIWEEKADHIKAKDLKFVPNDPLTRVEQKTVVIAYPDSVHTKDEQTLATLDNFLTTQFPAIQGLHILPSCEINEYRFNDGGFSQVKRDHVHPAYGTNQQFENMMEKYFSMTDLVLNHVDIDNPQFQNFLAGDDQMGHCFFIFKEEEYQKRLADGDFTQIFRPRPFPLFSIFRRQPIAEYAQLSWQDKVNCMNEAFKAQSLAPLPYELICILSIFTKIKNDQMLLMDEYNFIPLFIEFLTKHTSTPKDDVFTLSETQETQTTPYIFKPHIRKIFDLIQLVLPAVNIDSELAGQYAHIYQENDPKIFGESIRALTTFSHVQVDLNTTTFEGLKLLIDDFAWYLKMDLNMLRLDAANFAFKIWKTTCFGLPEVRKLLKILYISMEITTPRMIPNLEVNAPLSAVLTQMADKNTPPPMMYDFHLSSMLPVVFNIQDVRPLLEIKKMIHKYDIPHNAIRFSLDESHDGKSINGSGGADPLLTYAMRKKLIETVQKNGGFVKYKSSPPRQYPLKELAKVCRESRMDLNAFGSALFEDFSLEKNTLTLKSEIQNEKDIAQCLKINENILISDPALQFFVTKILKGKEPYELCISTRDALPQLDNKVLTVKRYLAFKTLGLALMGRHVKAIYFNDLMGLQNNHALVKATGELRNIKRTKSNLSDLTRLINDPSLPESWIAKYLNNTIALVDIDPAFSPRGSEADVFADQSNPAVAFILVKNQNDKSVIVINTADTKQRVTCPLQQSGMPSDKPYIDQLTGQKFNTTENLGTITLDLMPFDRLWLKTNQLEIPQKLTILIKGDMNTSMA